jgi:hypothetical protein
MSASNPMSARAGIRWVCQCIQPPILLAIYDQTGRIEIKVGDRYYIAQERMQAACPRCGTWHTLEVPGARTDRSIR